jgi:hypothetical protein
MDALFPDSNLSRLSEIKQQFDIFPRNSNKGTQGGTLGYISYWFVIPGDNLRYQCWQVDK